MNQVLLSKKLVYFLVFYVLFCGFAIKNLNASKSILFVIDVVYIVLFLRGNFRIKAAGLRFPLFILCLILINALIGILLNDGIIGNFLWGIRNQYFSCVLLLASASFLCINDIKKIFKFFFYFQFLNLGCAIYQYTILGYWGDDNNGAFVNGGGQDIFCGILVTYYLYRYVRHECKLWQFIFILLSSLLIAAIEEEKFIFIETAFIFFYFFLTGKIGLRNVFIALVFFVIMFFSLGTLADIGGENSLEILTDKEAFMEYQENAYEFPRIGSSEILEQMFFKEENQYYWGLGLGMCEESSTLDFINDDFYRRYGWLNYSWFTFHINFLQTGWVGIVLFLSFFVSILWSNIKNKKRAPQKLKYLYDVSNIIVILCVMTIWYNATLRSYNTLIPFFALSLGMIVSRWVKENSKNVPSSLQR